MNTIKLISKKKSLSKIPNSPGVYFFIKNNKYIYIGKANNLKNRLSSYFSKATDGKAKEIVNNSKYISYIEVNSEIEALLLEAKLINKYKPHYNSSLKDDKSPLYIIITKDKYPQVKSARKPDIALSRNHYGPFPTSNKVKEVLKILRKLFPYAQHKIGNKPCLYNHMNLCDPCPNVIEKIKNTSDKKAKTDEYIKNITYINGILSGRFNFVVKKLKKEMNNYSKEKMYEEALVIKNKLDTFEYITQPRIDINEVINNPNFTVDIRDSELKELKNILSKLGLKTNNLNRIECFDVSHLSGTHTTASMVTYIKGKEDKSFYRHFRIRSKTKSNDIASLEEVIKRRIKHLKTWGRPDLVIVDGGKAQVKIFFDNLEALNLPTIGLAKRFETLIIPKIENDIILYKEYRLPKGNARNLVQRIRNEAHRFAISYHRKLLSKGYLV
ncbi:GIY-YIG nuclease family protein [Patescibacteria group bacterium]